MQIIQTLVKLMGFNVSANVSLGAPTVQSRSNRFGNPTELTKTTITEILEMHLQEVQVGSLFEPNVQFRIPLFQRHYVWDREDQWQPLWEDIEWKLSLPQRQTQGFSHFTGAIVVQQKPTSVNEVPKYEIIDGQQRLTTFQILICAIRDRCVTLGTQNHAAIAKLADKRVLNQDLLPSDFADEEWKLIPTQYDKNSFHALVKRNPEESSGRIKGAYDYFTRKIVSYAGDSYSKMRDLFYSLGNFGFVQILLDPDDEPEKIFESINARGKSLLQFDLLRNNLFLRAGVDKRDCFYKKDWKHFETPYWDPEVENSGTSSELFLQHFLMAKLGTERVNPEFKAYQRQYRPRLQESQGIKYEFSELKRYSDIYQEMTDCKDDSEIGKRMKFYQIFNLTTLHPFILFITREVGLTGNELQRVFDILESYTIRRMLCRYGKRGLANYNIFFAELISEFQNNFSVENLIARLAEETSNTRRYPTDDEVEPTLHTRYDEHPILFPETEDSTIVFPDNRAVKAALHGLWVETAGAIRKRLIRYILYRIELHKRGENRFSEPGEVNFDKLTLEHVMPEKWHATWHLPIADGAILYEDDGVYLRRQPGDDSLLYDELFSGETTRAGLADESYADAFNLALARDHLLQSIGNLTLVVGPLNSSMSNNPFSVRREALSEHSGLTLNREICRHNNWDVNEIRNRAEKLIADFCKVWRPLDWFTENVS